MFVTNGHAGSKCEIHLYIYWQIQAKFQERLGAEVHKAFAQVSGCSESESLDGDKGRR